ncbi:MAG: lysine--tRNA ligase [Treponema sp.]|nr:lysine--tRNA ligase [Treponema sp.]
MIYELKGTGFWLDEACDKLLEYLKDLDPDSRSIICAAGMTPSAPIHFGILREVAISSFITDELVRRRRKASLVYYWDDYDHFCKIPYYTTKDAVSEHIGKTLRDVPDFNGSYNSYGEHYMHEFEECVHKCGFFPNYNYQSRMYKFGLYADRIRAALNKRKEIFDIVSRSSGMSEDEASVKRDSYYPLEVYCDKCGKDSTVTTSWNSEKDCIEYTCKNCGHKGSYIIGKDFRGKLAWKVNWATRWSDDCVCYESSGENQLTDTGSYSVSSRVATEIFGGHVPFSLLYRFIGMPGIAKVSRAQGEKTLATRLTGVLEPCIVRWLLLKNPPNKAFSVDIEEGIFRIYHEWDAFVDKIESGECTDLDRRIYNISMEGVEFSKFRIPFRTIIIALGICDGNKKTAAQQMLKMTGFNGTADELLVAAHSRINAAYYWLYKCGHVENQLSLRASFNDSAWQELSDACKNAVMQVCRNLDSFTNEDDAKKILYDIASQTGADKDLFHAIYMLCLGKERGPKLTTLLCLTQKEKLLALLKGDNK